MPDTVLLQISLKYPNANYCNVVVIKINTNKNCDTEEIRYIAARASLHGQVALLSGRRQRHEVGAQRLRADGQMREE